jgi:hypothetical protein
MACGITRRYDILRLTPNLYPYDIILGRGSVIPLGGALLRQPLSVPTVMLNCQRMSTSIDFDSSSFRLGATMEVKSWPKLTFTLHPHHVALTLAPLEQGERRRAAGEQS